MNNMEFKILISFNNSDKLITCSSMYLNAITDPGWKFTNFIAFPSNFTNSDFCIGNCSFTIHSYPPSAEFINFASFSNPIGEGKFPRVLYNNQHY